MEGGELLENLSIWHSIKDDVWVTRVKCNDSLV